MDKRVLFSIFALILLLAIFFVVFIADSTGKGVLPVSSTPAGARIFVDGKDQKKTTEAKLSLPPGKHKIRLELERYKTMEREVDVKAGNNEPVSLTLEAETRKVSIKSRPPEADIQLDDVARGIKTNTTLDLAPGSYKLVLSMKNYKDRKVTIQVPPGDGVHYLEVYTLEPDDVIQNGSSEPDKKTKQKVRIASVPLGAEIFLDGVARGKTDKVFDDLKIGTTYQLALKKTGYREVRESITIKPGDDLFYDLVPDRPGERFALLIGVRDYGSRMPEYAFADTDAADLAQALNQAGYPEKNVKLLTEGAQLTRSSIRDELLKLARGKIADDGIVLLLAGHGLRFGDDSYFCPADADPRDKNSLISLGEIYDSLKVCRAGLKVVLLETCGFGIDAASVPAVGRPGIVPEGKALPPDGVAVFFNSGAAAQGYLDMQWRRSVFMNAIIRGVCGEADRNDDKAITLAELKEFVQDTVKSYVRKEYPSQEPPQLPELAGRTLARPLSEVQGVLVPFSKGCKKLAQEDYKNALDDFKEALDLNRNFTPAYLQRAFANIQNMKFAEAIGDCDEAIKIDSKCADAFCLRGEARCRNKQLEEGKNDFSEAIRLAPNYSVPFDLRARMVHRKNKDYAAALKDHDAAIALAPMYYWYYNNRGFTYHTINEIEKAKKDYLKTIELNPGYFAPYQNLADIYVDIDETKAKEWQNKANKIKKSSGK